VHSFATTTTSSIRASTGYIHAPASSRYTSTKLFATNNNDDDNTNSNDAAAKKLFPNDDHVQILEFTLPEHKPLGCTAEESLDATAEHFQDLPKPPVFICKLVESGNAQTAGLQVGDVILELSSGMMNANSNDASMEDVHGMGLERVKSLVSATDYNQNLVIKVARGTSVMERHEAALMKLCEIDSTAEDKQFDGYITSFLKGGMDDNVYDTTNLSDETAASQCDAEDEECIMNVMCDLWGEECEVLGTNHITAKEKEEKKQQQQQKKKEEAEKPAKSSYFSRSSPSGTFIRDPKTGKLENVDAK